MDFLGIRGNPRALHPIVPRLLRHLVGGSAGILWNMHTYVYSYSQLYSQHTHAHTHPSPICLRLTFWIASSSTHWLFLAVTHYVFGNAATRGKTDITMWYFIKKLQSFDTFGLRGWSKMTKSLQGLQFRLSRLTIIDSIFLIFRIETAPRWQAHWNRLLDFSSFIMKK